MYTHVTDMIFPWNLAINHIFCCCWLAAVLCMQAYYAHMRIRCESAPLCGATHSAEITAIIIIIVMEWNDMYSHRMEITAPRSSSSFGVPVAVPALQPSIVCVCVRTNIAPHRPAVDGLFSFSLFSGCALSLPLPVVVCMRSLPSFICGREIHM